MPFFLVAALLSSVAAGAQLAAYGAFEATNLSGTTLDLSNSGSFVTGGTFGVYDDAFGIGPVHLGADVRGSVLSGDNSKTLHKYFAGVRLAVKPPTAAD